MALDPQSVFLGETVTKQMLLLQSREAIQLLSMLTESTGNNKLPLHITILQFFLGMDVIYILRMANQKIRIITAHELCPS